MLLGVICAVVANVGLSQLISLSIPVLVAIYPVAVALVLVTFLKGYFGRPRLVFRACVGGCLPVRLPGWSGCCRYEDGCVCLPAAVRQRPRLAAATLLACVVGMMVRPAEMAAEAA